MLPRTSFAIFVSAAVLVAAYVWASDATWLLPDLLDDAHMVRQQAVAMSRAGTPEAMVASCTGAGPC